MYTNIYSNTPYYSLKGEILSYFIVVYRFGLIQTTLKYNTYLLIKLQTYYRKTFFFKILAVFLPCTPFSTLPTYWSIKIHNALQISIKWCYFCPWLTHKTTAASTFRPLQNLSFLFLVWVGMIIIWFQEPRGCHF